MYSYGCFGFKKELIRQIGGFDETFVGGGWEDTDFRLRLYQANLPFYETREIPYLYKKSTWDYDKVVHIFYSKWVGLDKYIIKTRPDIYDGSLGKSSNQPWYDINKGVANSYTDPKACHGNFWIYHNQYLHRKLLLGY